MRVLFVALILAAPLPAFAQVDGPAGIAFVQAPEQASGMAMGRTPAEAFASATAACVDGGAYPDDCIPTNWCQPAGWSVDVFAQHQEGIHWHEVVCGLPSEAIAHSVGESLCEASERPFLIECMVTQVYDPEGKPRMEW